MEHGVPAVVVKGIIISSYYDINHIDMVALGTQQQSLANINTIITINPFCVPV